MKRQRRASSMRAFYLALAGVVIVGGAFLAWQYMKPKEGARVTDAAVPIKAEGYLLGSADAPVQILEFADFECPACSNFSTITEPDVRKRIVDAGLASFRFYDFPLPQHKHTMKASNTAACADDQGKFWEMHDRIFAGQNDWAPSRNPRGIFEEYAREIGLDVAKWKECYEDGRHQPRIEANRAEGERRGVSSTPSFVIGRRLVPGSLPYDVIKAYVDSATREASVKVAGTLNDGAKIKGDSTGAAVDSTNTP
ncbi:MAG: thioredoxin domain-containing protein [Gemmatimonadaceae bacterium]